MELGLAGKKAIITGGSRGIGRYTSELLAAEGCDVAFCGRNETDVKDASDQINARTGGTAIGFKADLTDEQQTRGFVARALDARFVRTRDQELHTHDPDKVEAVLQRARFRKARKASGGMFVQGRFIAE